MSKYKKVKKMLAVSLLVFNLAGSNFIASLAMAQDEAAANDAISQTGDSSVATGDSNIVIDAQNSVNTNEIDLGGNNSQSENSAVIPALSPEPTPIPSLIPSSESSPISDLISTPTPSPVNNVNFENTNTNNAEVANSVMENGESGGNIASSENGNVSIDTGDVNVVMGLVNTVNTNIVNSSFSQFLFNLFQNSSGSINLSDQIGNGQQGGCGDSEGCLNSQNITNNNQGSIENNALINASSGGNFAFSQNGNAIINTGDVNAVANIFNFLNTNIVGANWYNLIINIFDDWTGDLVMPGKAKMGEFLNSSGNIGSGCVGGNCGISINNSDEAMIQNQVVVNADTGANSATGDSTIIRTGEANAQANIINVANTSSVGGNWFFMAVNNMGTWEGQVFSLPPGLMASGDLSGTKIYNITPDALGGENSAGAGSSAGQSNNYTVNNTNTGNIKNSIVLNVLTGGNSASGNGASINTGNANALLNLINILNSNINGGNWLLGMINIFGKWKGNLAFGRPDLWVGANAVDAPVAPGSGQIINYNLTYTNKGDADATNAAIVGDYDERYFSVEDSGAGIVDEKTGKIRWSLGNVPVGKIGSVSFSLMVGSVIPYGFTSVGSQIDISSLETDWASDDNVDEIITEIYRRPFQWMPPSPNLKIEKTRVDDDLVYSGDSVRYKITMINESDGRALDVSVDDILTDKSGETISSANWKLGEVFPREKIIIEYTLAIGSEIPAGSYTGATQAKGFDNYGTPMNYPKLLSILEVNRKEKEVIVVDSEEEAEIAPEIIPVDAIAQSPESANMEIEAAADSIVIIPQKENKPAVVAWNNNLKPIPNIDDVIKDVLGAEAMAKDETSSLNSNGEENNAPLSGAAAEEELVKDPETNGVMRFIGPTLLVLAGFYVFFRRKGAN